MVEKSQQDEYFHHSVPSFVGYHRLLFYGMYLSFICNLMLRYYFSIGSFGFDIVFWWLLFESISNRITKLNLKKSQKYNVDTSHNLPSHPKYLFLLRGYFFLPTQSKACIKRVIFIYNTRVLHDFKNALYTCRNVLYGCGNALYDWRRALHDCENVLYALHKCFVRLIGCFAQLTEGLCTTAKTFCTATEILCTLCIDALLACGNALHRRISIKTPKTASITSLFG